MSTAAEITPAPARQECLILVRMPEGGILVMTDYACDSGDWGAVATFPDRATAEAIAKDHSLLKAYPLQIVELEI